MIKKMRKKTLFALAIVCLFLSVAAAPAIGQTLFTKNSKKTGDNDPYYIRMYIVKNGEVTVIKEKITETEYNDITSDLKTNDIKTTVENLGTAIEGYQNGQTDYNEVQNEANSVSSKINNALPANTQVDIAEAIPTETALTGGFVPSVVISAGFANRAYTMAFEEPEAFAGFMFAPIITNYESGYTGQLMWPLIRISYKDRAGAHSVQTIGFAGIYLNIGKLGLGQGNFVCYAGLSLVNMLPAA